MTVCSLCKHRVFTHNFAGPVNEVDYKTGGFILHPGVCIQCQMDILRRNDLYRLLVMYFRSHPQKLETLRQTHLEDIKAA